MIAASGPTALWYAARSTGYVSLLLLTAIVVLGVVTTLRWNRREWPRFLVQALHRNLSLLVLIFLAIHIITSVVDPFAGIAVLNTVAPFTGSYRPVWLGLGVVSMELLVALTITSLLRQRIAFWAWRAVHWTAYACWPLAMLHTLGTGSDVKSSWALILGLGCVGAVVLALAWRFTSDQQRLPGVVRVVALAATAAATISLLAFAAVGPLHAGWARAAGTPQRLLAASAGTPTAAPARVLAVGLHDQLSGSVARSGDTIQVTLSDSRDPSLRVIVAVTGTAATGRLAITEKGSTVCDAPASVTQDVVATCGHTAVDVSLIQQADGSVVGQMVTTAAGR